MILRLYRSLPETQQQFISFCFVGLVGIFVVNGTLSLLTRGFGMGPIVSRVISEFVFAMTATWLLNRTLTFRNRRKQPLWQEYLKFAAANGVGNLANLGTYTVLVKTMSFFAQFPEMAVVAGTAVGLVFNFTGSKYFVFRRSES